MATMIIRRLREYGNMDRYLIAIVLGSIMVLAEGCGSSRSLKPRNEICVSGTSPALIFAAAQKTLEEMYFDIEKADAETGYISTRPLPAAQLFELWRSDTVGAYNFAEANLHSVQKIVAITIQPKDGKSGIICEVKTQRLSLPQLEVNSATELPRLFTTSDTTLQRLNFKKNQRKQAQWIDADNDEILQAKILQKIEKRLKAL